jgi:hypothetical protein
MPIGVLDPQVLSRMLSAPLPTPLPGIFRTGRRASVFIVPERLLLKKQIPDANGESPLATILLRAESAKYAPHCSHDAILAEQER